MRHGSWDDPVKPKDRPRKKHGPRIRSQKRRKHYLRQKGSE